MAAPAAAPLAGARIDPAVMRAWSRHAQEKEARIAQQRAFYEAIPTILSNLSREQIRTAKWGASNEEFLDDVIDDCLDVTEPARFTGPIQPPIPTGHLPVLFMAIRKGDSLALTALRHLRELPSYRAYVKTALKPWVLRYGSI